MNLPAPILSYPCKNQDCDSHPERYENSHSAQSLYYWDGIDLPDWTDDDAERRSMIDHGEGFYCGHCLGLLGIPIEKDEISLRDALKSKENK